MSIGRRTFLGLCGLAAAQRVFGSTPLRPAAKAGRVVIVGAGWGGLAAAAELRRLAPALDIVLIDAQARFRSLALSGKWLFGLVDENLLEYDLATAAAHFGYTFIAATVTELDRARRTVRTAGGSIDYDWLVLATGISHDWRAWFGDDVRAIAEARTRFDPAYLPERAGQHALRRRLHEFAGGDLLMTLPPAPYRCPPAPYERAALIGRMLQAKKIPGRLVVLDPNPMMLAFARIFHDRYDGKVVYVPQARITAIDPFARTLATEFDEYRFTEAILMPPQRAGALVHAAGLAERGADGRPGAWAAQDPVTLQAQADERIFLVGDLIGRASLLFGHYPKSGHMAAELGRIAAAQIAARALGQEAPRTLPDSVCYVLSRVEPEEMFRIETGYRFRGDGVIQQRVDQEFVAQPRGEDVDWAKGQFATLLGAD